MLTTIVVYALLSATIWTDLKDGKIYNWTTYPGIGVALAVGAMNSYFPGSASVRQLFGAVDLGDATLGLFACGAILIVCYVFLNFNGGIGGGDVKLLAMLGAFFGFEKGIEVLLWTFILAAAIAVMMLIWTVKPTTLVHRFITRVRSIALLQTPEYPEGEAPMAPLPKCLPIGAAAATTLVHFNLLTHLGLI